MRCLSCNIVLSDFEATRKFISGAYVDLCNKCYNKSYLQDLIVIENPALKTYDDLEENFDDSTCL